MIEAVIFDMDGIIIDSEPFWRQAEIDVFKGVDIHLTEADCLKTLGFRIDEVEDYWFERQPWPNRQRGEISEKIVDQMVHYISTEGKAMDGVYHALDLFKSMNLPMAVASSSHMRLIHAVIKRLNIEPYFEILCSAENEEFGKPHPAVFISAAKALNVAPNKCLIIEDSPSGVIAARASKAKVIAIPEALNKDRAEMGIADITLSSLLDLNSKLIDSI